jgi:hypothetical protein
MSKEKLSVRIKNRFRSGSVFEAPRDGNLIKEIEELEVEIKTLKDMLDCANAVAKANNQMWEKSETRLAKAQELIEKWRSKYNGTVSVYAVNDCADELEKALGGDES